MKFICDPEYAKAINRLGGIIPGVAGGSYDKPDPELLAKLREKGMDIRDKKRSGAFYTPPEIVRFMCRETLAHYISNRTGIPFDKIGAFVSEGEDDARNKLLHGCLQDHIGSMDIALAGVRMFDPSVGCGAFALGMLEEIVRLRKIIAESALKTDKLPYSVEKSTTSQLLMDTVQNSIFAADTDPVSVEITALRLWHRIASAAENETFEDPGGHIGAEGSRGVLPGYSSFKHNVITADSIFEYNGRNFDIVIGNPPYISAVEGARKNKDSRRALREKFPLLSGAFDIYTAFLLDGIQKTNENGVFCWIIPNKFLVSQYAAPVLEHLKRNGLMKSISISDIGAFTGVGVYPIIITGNKHRTGDKPDKPDFTEYRADSLDDLAERKFYPVDRQRKQEKYETFADHNIKIASGAAGFQARSLSRHIISDPGDAADGQEIIPFVVSGCIGRYSIRYEKVRYMGVTYDKAYIKKGEDIADSKWRMWQNEKICVAGLSTQIHAYYSRDPLAIGVGTYAIYDFGDFDPLFLLGVLNSSFMSRYVNDKFHERHLAGGYLAINKSMLEQLPIVKADMATQEEIGKKAARLLELPRDCQKARQLSYEIDELVNQLYEL